MKRLIIKFFAAAILIQLLPFSVFSQPIPVELMGGNNYGTFKMILNKKFSENSKFGVFHINILQFDYIKGTDNDIMLQDLLFFEPIKNFRITGGGFYAGKPGFLPTIGMQYKLIKKAFFFLLSPRVNIKDKLSEGDIFSIIQFEPQISEKLNLCVGVQSLNLFNKEGNIKCSQELRLGLSIKAFQFGLAANFDRIGSSFIPSNNFGVYVATDIF